MPKKLKLDLGGLKVQSFVTSLDNGDEKKIKAGATAATCGGETCDPECPLTEYTCQTDCGTCNTCPISCGGSCATCNPKVYTCDPECI